ncbi:MAG: tRNA-uridine aminocarboxypropyltransferase [Myxococcota bacterium]
MSRDYCYACFKHSLLCVCDVAEVEHRVGVRILQHPAERQHPINSARIVQAGLKRATLEIAWNLESERPSKLAPDAAVLFPSDDSVALEELGVHEHPSELVVIDGTWAQARKLYRRSSWLHTLRHVHLTPSAPSRYRIRRQPRSDYLSTVEAVVSALSILEPDNPGFDVLLERFDRMIDTQARFIADPPPGGYQHRRLEGGGRSPALPSFFRWRHHAVLACLDFHKPDPPHPARIQPVVLSLQRWPNGESVDFVVRGETDHPSSEHLAYMGLSLERYRHGEPLATVRTKMREFLRPDDALVTWKRSSLRPICALAQFDGPGVALKTDYCNWTRSRPGHLAEVAADLPDRESNRCAPALLRVRQRLHALAKVAQWLENSVEQALIESRD